MSREVETGDVFLWCVVAALIVWAACSKACGCADPAAAQDRPRRAAAAVCLVAEADMHVQDWPIILDVLAKRSSDVNRAARAYCSIFHTVNGLSPRSMRRREAILAGTGARGAQVAEAERYLANWRAHAVVPSRCDPDEWGDRDGDARRAARAGWTQVDCGPECHLPQRRDDAPGCVLNRYWSRQRGPVDAALARGRR